MKRLSIILAALLLLLCSCSTGLQRLEKAGYSFEENSVVNNTGSTEINVFNWGEYMNEDLNEAFTHVTGIKVNYVTYDTNEILYADLKTGRSSYDVIIPSDYMIGRLIDEDMLLPLDFSNIPNFDNINPDLKNREYDPENLYSVPYMWGSVGIIYDTTRVAEPVDSWGALFDERYSGQIIMFDNARDAFGIALKYLGYSFNTTSEDELREAYDLLVMQEPLLQGRFMDQVKEKLKKGEAILGPYYAGDAAIMMEENDKLGFAIPKEGTNVFIDAFCIPKGANNKTAAEMYINFMCSYNAGMANVEEIGYSTPLLDVYNDLPDEIKNDGFSYPSDLSNYQVFTNLPEETLKLYNRLWEDLTM